MAAAPLVEILVPQARAYTRAGFCDRCAGSRARYATSAGPRCGSCWSRLQATARERQRELAAAYGLPDTDTLCEALVDDHGRVSWLPSAGPLPALRYHPSAEQAAALLTDDELLYQPRAIARALWGVCLQWGVRLQSYPRAGAYPPEELDFGIVLWAAEEKGRLLWLIRYAAAVQKRYFQRYKRGHGSLTEALPWVRGAYHEGVLSALPLTDHLRPDGRPTPPGVVSVVDRDTELAAQAA